MPIAAIAIPLYSIAQHTKYSIATDLPWQPATKTVHYFLKHPNDLQPIFMR